ncbi:hypothetical protein HY065_02530 [Candidatus Berkelbacteria bacterium]|nr:hypothetical protein [Candidatus Berkelbacteria bacterium]
MAKIYTIPTDFYGGKNPAPPEIQTQQRVAPPASAPAPKIMARPQSVQTGTQKLTTPVPAGRPVWVVPVSIVGAVIILGGGFAAWWFLKTPPPAPVVVAPPPAPVVQAPAPVVPEIATSTTSTPAIATSTPPVAVALVPPHTFTDSADSDHDGLTDVEEELWGTNPTLADTDGDGYPDQTELLNLYNPIGVAPQRLADAKLVNTYINPTFNYLVYYHKDWVPGALDASNREVLFTASTGEYVEIHAVPFPTTQPFPEWFAQNLPGEDLTKYQPFKNRFQVSGIMSPDKAVALISDSANIYVIYYNGGSRTEINYRTTFRMMVASFKPTGVATPVDLLPSVALQSSTSTTSVTSATSSAQFPAATSTVPAVITTSTSSTAATSTPKTVKPAGVVPKKIK